MFRWLSRRRRATLRQTALPAAWHALIERNVPYVSHLPASDRDELDGHVQVFLAEKSFEGCGGLDMTDEIRVTIAAQACILLLHREMDYFAKLVSILVYPSTYVVPGCQHVGGGIMNADVWPGPACSATTSTPSWSQYVIRTTTSLTGTAPPTHPSSLRSSRRRSSRSLDS